LKAAADGAAAMRLRKDAMIGDGSDATRNETADADESHLGE